MKHLLLLIAIVIHLSFVSSPPSGTVVYVCVSKSSVAYHSTNTCSGLSRCSHEIKAMSISDAIAMGKRDCHICHPPTR